ncbi:early nodulin-like protein 3 [Phoenix dactylifera]|uniref:Early nodulin-like protein 3 n=1 Tax=Phoenix dactylifera TaxID=42345 RepID=A0A8B7C954_PHODC|nr:early nodulin-like protein 3 [Phoenix dactylifera]
MASPLLSSLVFLVLLLIVGSSEAKDFLVGGNTEAWKIPSSPSETLNQWAEANRFLVGDSLVWKYDGKKDSVLEVTREGYLSCTTSSPIAEHKDGSTVVKLPRSGPYYFISGAEGACEKGEKLIVVVISERLHRYRGISPAPSPLEYDGPAMAPVSSGQKLAGGITGGLVGVLAVIGMVARIL